MKQIIFTLILLLSFEEIYSNDYEDISYLECKNGYASVNKRHPINCCNFKDLNSTTDSLTAVLTYNKLNKKTQIWIDSDNKISLAGLTMKWIDCDVEDDYYTCRENNKRFYKKGEKNEKGYIDSLSGHSFYDAKATLNRKTGKFNFEYISDILNENDNLQTITKLKGSLNCTKLDKNKF